MKKVYKNGRKKAFWGAIVGGLIGAGASLLGSKLSADQNERNAEKQLELAKRENEISQTQQLATAMNEQLAGSQQYYNDLRKSVHKCGGKIKVKRKKAEWGINDTGAVISSGLSALGGIGSTLITNNSNQKVFDANIEQQNMRFVNQHQVNNLGIKRKDGFDFIDDIQSIGTIPQREMFGGKRQMKGKKNLYLS